MLKRLPFMMDKKYTVYSERPERQSQLDAEYFEKDFVANTDSLDDAVLLSFLTTYGCVAVRLDDLNAVDLIDTRDFRDTLANKTIETIGEYVSDGGLLWLDSSTLPPHEQFLATTDDDSYISDLYDSCRETGFDGTLDEFCGYCENQALDWALTHTDLTSDVIEMVRWWKK